MLPPGHDVTIRKCNNCATTRSNPVATKPDAISSSRPCSAEIFRRFLQIRIADTSTSSADFDIHVTDVNESPVGVVTDEDTAANTLAEDAGVGTLVGITALATDPDVGDTVSYGVNDARFSIDGGGVVTVAAGASFDAETEGTINLTVTATSTDLSTSNAVFPIAVTAVITADGDLNEDGVVDAADVLIATRIILGIDSATQVQEQHMDVAPLVGGEPMPDGVLNAADLLIIQQKALLLVNF